jgi:hypothetical protein
MSTPPLAHKMQYRSAVQDRLTVELDSAAVIDLITIQDILRRESQAPTVPVSRSLATRRALHIYAASLARQTEGSLLAEAGRANANNHIRK